MRIVIEALGIQDYGGGRTATLNLLEPLLQIDKHSEYRIILSKYEPSLDTDTGNVHQIISPLKNRFSSRIWAQLYLPNAFRDFDLIHFTKNQSVFGINIPNIITIYDLTTILYPELFPKVDVWYWKTILRRAFQTTDHIIAISNTTARDIESWCKIPSERIHVIYPGISPLYKPSSDQEIMNMRNRYNLPDKYLLHVGRIDKKKNLTILIKAFSHLRKMGFHGKLVFVGRVCQKNPDNTLLPTIVGLGLEQDVIFLGQLPEEDLPAIYSGALIEILPSLHEGFGLVAVEAMACGTPLVTHSAGAVIEVVSDAALVLNDNNADTLSDAIKMLLDDPERLSTMREKGIKRADLFQRDRTARQTLSLYESISG